MFNEYVPPCLVRPRSRGIEPIMENWPHFISAKKAKTCLLWITETWLPYYHLLVWRLSSKRYSAMLWNSVSKSALVNLTYQHMNATVNLLHSLHLCNAGLNDFPARVLHLTNIQSLLLPSNDISVLPESISFLVHLKELSMSGNKLRELPRDFIQLRKLTDLYLCANHLTELPHDFGDLCELQTLTLNGNLLKSLPRILQNCTKLKNLLVCGNPLKHTPPLFNLGSLRELWVIGLNTDTNTFQEPSLNHFSKSLEVLFADENKFDDIPDVRHIGNLIYLSLSSNRIRALPPRFCELHSLSVLNLSCNRLRMLPEEFCKLTGLRELRLCCNSLTALPKDFSKLKQLSLLSLNGNTFEHFPDAVRDMQSLKILFWVANPCSDDLDLRNIAMKGTLFTDGHVSKCQHSLKAVRSGSYDSECPVMNLLVEQGSSTLIVAFGTYGFEWGGVLTSCCGDTDVLYLHDQYKSSYRQDGIDAFLRKVGSKYSEVLAIGTSQAAFGAVYHNQCFDRVLAFSPMMNGFDIQKMHRVMNPLHRRTSCKVSIIAGRLNPLDVSACNMFLNFFVKSTVKVTFYESGEHGARALCGRNLNSVVKAWKN